MGKHTLEIDYDYQFLLIGISSHEKDYRLCWAINKKLDIELAKQDSFEIKGKKQTTPSFFSFFLFENPDAFREYVVVANLSESKDASSDSLFKENEYLIPEQKMMDYFLIVRGELEEDESEDILNKLREINVIQTAVRIDVTSLKSKQNLIF